MDPGPIANMTMKRTKATMLRYLAQSYFSYKAENQSRKLIHSLIYYTLLDSIL